MTTQFKRSRHPRDEKSTELTTTSCSGSSNPIERAVIEVVLTSGVLLATMFLFCFYLETPPFMDWTLALQRNQTILLRNVAWLFTWLKLEVGETVETLPRLNFWTVLFVLRPSESACRRLIYAAMFVRGIVAAPFRERVAGGARAERKKSIGERSQRVPSFKLIDPRKRFDLFPNKPKIAKGPGPQITDIWSDDPIYDRSDIYAYHERMARLRLRSAEDEINAVSLCLRMAALKAALEDLEGQAQRLANLQARLQRRSERTGKPFLSPLRPGLPPGHRQRERHEVDEVLKETQQLAFMAEQDFPPPDSG